MARLRWGAARGGQSGHHPRSSHGPASLAPDAPPGCWHCQQKEEAVAAISVRGLDDEVRERLRVPAARNGGPWRRRSARPSRQRSATPSRPPTSSPPCWSASAVRGRRAAHPAADLTGAGSGLLRAVVLDTHVVSELMRPCPDPTVVTWLGRQMRDPSSRPPSPWPRSASVSRGSLRGGVPWTCGSSPTRCSGPFPARSCPSTLPPRAVRRHRSGTGARRTPRRRPRRTDRRDLSRALRLADHAQHPGIRRHRRRSPRPLQA